MTDPPSPVLLELATLDPGDEERVALQVEGLGPVRLGYSHVADRHAASCHLDGRLRDIGRRTSGRAQGRHTTRYLS